VVINNNRAGFTLINLETEGIVAGDLSNRETDGYITSAKKATLKGYQTYSGIKGQDNTELLFINKGTVNLNVANTTYLFTTSHNNGGLRTNYIDNEGTISAKGENSVIIKHSPDTSQAKAWIYSNNGTMKAEGKGSIVYGAAYSNLQYGRAAFINDGTIEVTGESAIGVILPKDSANSKLADGHLVWLKKPILLKGTKSMGFVAQNTNISNIKNLVKFNINAAVSTLDKNANSNACSEAWRDARSSAKFNAKFNDGIEIYELMSPIDRQILPASIEEKIRFYEKVRKLRLAGAKFQIMRDAFLNYRLLRCTVKFDGEAQKSFVLFGSHFRRNLIKFKDFANAMITQKGAFMASCYKYISQQAAEDPNLVKLVLDNAGFAIYFSRSLIPYPRAACECYLGHIGIYAYSVRNLKRFCALPASALEDTEKLEQLRAISAGEKIAMLGIETASIGIDTSADYERALKEFGNGI